MDSVPAVRVAEGVGMPFGQGGPLVALCGDHKVFKGESIHDLCCIKNK